MTDREMLEFAAKAAGKSVISGSKESEKGIFTTLGWWNPLTDDGDRYRLIATLKLGVDFSDCTVWYRYACGQLIQDYWGGDYGDEAHAVLRVAATMGKAQQ